MPLFKFLATAALCVVFASFVLACASIPARHQAIDSVAFDGTERVSGSDLNERIATNASPEFLGLFRGVVYDYELFDHLTLQRDLARIERYYRARGFYDAHVRAARVVTKSRKHVAITIIVDEGEPVLVHRVRLLGTDALAPDLRTELARNATRSLRLESAFDEDDLDASIAQVERTLKDRGYAHEKVARDVTVDVVTRRADVVLTVTPSTRAVLGKVTIEGLGPLPEAPIRRALDLAEGEPYSQSAIEAARQAVLDLGVTSSVEITPQLAPTENPGVVPLVVHVEPGRLHTVRLGVGGEFDAIKTDVHALVGYENHDLLGGLRTFSVSFRPGLVFYPLSTDNWVKPEQLLPEFQLRTELRQPGFLEARTNGLIRPELSLFPVLLPTVSNAMKAIPGYLEFKTSVGVDRSMWRLYAALTENVQIEKPIEYRGPPDPALKTLVLSYPELITNLDLSNSRLRPHKGAWIGNSIQFAGGPFGGDASDLRVRPDARGYVPLGKHVTFALRGSLGFLFPRNYGSTLRDVGIVADNSDRLRDVQIVFFRGFFAGGANSNRGYPLRGIGPYRIVTSPAFGGATSIAACAASSPALSGCRIPVGGATLWESSAEVRFDVTGPFSMATFCDAADVSARTMDIRLDHLHLSCGLGARYDTPVGPIRFDVAYRIPGLQVIPRPDPTEVPPDPLFGVLPIALAFGLGEAY